MKQEAKQVWLEALRSGSYDQGKSQLKNDTGPVTTYCCLGVLCDLVADRKVGGSGRWERLDEPDENDTQLVFTVGLAEPARGQRSGIYVPEKLAEELGIPMALQERLASMNDDQGLSFKELADYIEKYL